MSLEHVLPLQVCSTRSAPMGTAFRLQIFQRALNSYRKACEQGKGSQRAVGSLRDLSSVEGRRLGAALLPHCQQSRGWCIWEWFYISPFWVLDASLQDRRHHLSFPESSHCSPFWHSSCLHTGWSLALFWLGCNTMLVLGPAVPHEHRF